MRTALDTIWPRPPAAGTLNGPNLRAVPLHRWCLHALVLGPVLAILGPPAAFAQVDLMKDCQRLEEPEGAIRACTDLLRALPDTATVYNHRGVAYMRRGCGIQCHADTHSTARRTGFR